MDLQVDLMGNSYFSISLRDGSYFQLAMRRTLNCGLFFSRILKRSGFTSRFDEKLIFFHFSQITLFSPCFEEETAFSLIFWQNLEEEWICK